MRRGMNTLLIVAILCLSLIGIAASSDVGCSEESNCTLRIYGTYGEGPGNQIMDDPANPGFKPENPPYTDPEAPFYPQAEQAPRKDFVTFNPAIMDHNQGWDELLFYPCGGGPTIQTPKEKVFKRMWYEKEWFKDYTEDGIWNVVLEKTDTTFIGPDTVIVDVNDEEELHSWVSLGYRIIEYNNPEVDGERDADIYGPAVNQEFTYMMTDSDTQPIMVSAGSRIFIPMAHDDAVSYRGLNSFDADADGSKDTVTVESEATLGFDIDGNGIESSMDNDGIEVSADESIVFVLENKALNLGEQLQFFDNKVTMEGVNNLGPNPSATFNVYDNEGGVPACTETVVIPLGGREFFSRGVQNSGNNPQGPFFIELVALSDGSATVRVGRMFGEVGANIGVNPAWNQKAFIVDEVFYNVVAIKAKEDCFKYITFRQKLPKTPIKLYGKHLKVWNEGEILPEMPPFCMDHEVLLDVQNTQTIPQSWQDKIGPKVCRPPLEIKYVEESVEERYFGELKEIYDESETSIDIPISLVFGLDSSGSMVSTDPSNLRLQASTDTIDMLDSSKDEVGVVSWDGTIDFTQALTDNFTLAKTQVVNVGNSGFSTNLNLGLQGCIDVLDASNKADSAKVIIFLTDGSGSYTFAGAGGPAAEAAAKGYRIYSIGLTIASGSGAESNLIDMATATGGEYYSAPDAASLEAIFDQIREDVEEESERWILEWFYTYPDQYTEFVLPEGQLYLVTLSWVAPESCIHIWDGDSTGPIDAWQEERVKFWYDGVDSTGLYVNELDDTSSIRIYGTYGEGPGNQTMDDPANPGFKPENPPYTDPEAPFYPQAEQAPRKDFMTFNPAIMDHNQGWDELLLYPCGGGPTIQTPKEKVFKRMWYEKEWFKDYTEDGIWNVVLEKTDMDVIGPDTVIVDVNDEDELHDWISLGYRIIEYNNPEVDGERDADIYGPAVNQEFTYMMTDSDTQPIMVSAGSRIFIPMAHDDAVSYRGLNSFDADADGSKDTVTVESEATLGFDIDGDGIKSSMDTDEIEVSADESIVFVLENKALNVDEQLQFFDNKVTLKEVNNLGQNPSATFDVYDNEGGIPACTKTVVIPLNNREFFSRGVQNSGNTPQGPFFVELVALSDESATIRVGRMFGQVGANIGVNPAWNQKAFIVDEVFYNVVAIKTKEDCFKYITFRQKLPKTPIKLYGKHLEVWDEGEILPEMPPFCMNHEILVDVQNTQTIPENWQDKIGPNMCRPPLEITYVEESVEERYFGELKEIYNETLEDNEETERWLLEWFYTYPDQYTEFVVPKGELYLMTLSWFAPESCIHIWDGDPTGPIDAWQGERVKFWHDPGITDDLYVNGVVGASPNEGDVCGDVNDDGTVDMGDAVRIMNYWLYGETQYPLLADGDVNDDGTVDMGDAMRIMNYWLYGETQYPLICD